MIKPSGALARRCLSVIDHKSGSMGSGYLIGSCTALSLHLADSSSRASTCHWVRVTARQQVLFGLSRMRCEHPKANVKDEQVDRANRRRSARGGWVVPKPS